MFQHAARHSPDSCARSCSHRASSQPPSTQCSSVIMLLVLCLVYTACNFQLFQSTQLRLSVTGYRAPASSAWPAQSNRSASVSPSTLSAPTRRRWTSCPACSPRSSRRSPASPAGLPGTVRYLCTVPYLHLQHPLPGRPEDVAYLLPAAAPARLAPAVAQVVLGPAVAGTYPRPAARPRHAADYHLPRLVAARDQDPPAAQVPTRLAVVLGPNRYLQPAQVFETKHQAKKVEAFATHSLYQPVPLVPAPLCSSRCRRRSVLLARSTKVQPTRQVAPRVVLLPAHVALAALPGPAVAHRPSHSPDSFLPQHSLALR